MGKKNRFEDFLTNEQKNNINEFLKNLDLATPSIKKHLRNDLYNYQLNYDSHNNNSLLPEKHLKIYTQKWANDTLSTMRCRAKSYPILFGVVAFSLSLPIAGQCLSNLTILSGPEAWLIAACIALVVTAAVAIPLAVTQKNKANLFRSETRLVRSDSYLASCPR